VPVQATVGAGLPIVSTLRSLLETGDRVTKIEGILSGTLSYIFNTYKAGGWQGCWAAVDCPVHVTFEACVKGVCQKRLDAVMMAIRPELGCTLLYVKLAIEPTLLLEVHNETVLFTAVPLAGAG